MENLENIFDTYLNGNKADAYKAIKETSNNEILKFLALCKIRINEANKSYYKDVYEAANKLYNSTIFEIDLRLNK